MRKIRTIIWKSIGDDRGLREEYTRRKYQFGDNSRTLDITREMHMRAVAYYIMHRTITRDVLGRR
jgi:hypothetical protein